MRTSYRNEPHLLTTIPQHYIHFSNQQYTALLVFFHRVTEPCTRRELYHRHCLPCVIVDLLMENHLQNMQSQKAFQVHDDGAMKSLAYNL